VVQSCKDLLVRLVRLVVQSCKDFLLVQVLVQVLGRGLGLVRLQLEVVSRWVEWRKGSSGSIAH
jgi:hypothetical protein